MPKKAKKAKAKEYWFSKYQVPDLPVGTKGSWAIQKFEVEPEAAAMHQLSCMFSMGGIGSRRGIREGHYTRLAHKHRGVVMSDTPAEINDHYEAFLQTEAAAKAGGATILVHGLGMGMFPNYCLQLKGVEHVTIVEIDPEVIALTGAHYLKKYGADRLTIIEADAEKWKPEPHSFWDVVWHDIWDSICEDNWDSIKSFHRRFGSRAGWQGSWSRPEIQRMQRQDRERSWW